MRCPPGRVCDVPGLKSPIKICPSCFWCEGDTNQDYMLNATEAALDPPLYGGMPRKGPNLCPAGSFCLGETMSNITQDGNFSAPQTCTDGYFCESGACSAAGTGICPVGTCLFHSDSHAIEVELKSPLCVVLRSKLSRTGAKCTALHGNAARTLSAGQSVTKIGFKSTLVVNFRFN